MAGQPRSPSAIIMSAVVFGAIANPFFYLVRGLGASYTVEFLVLAMPLLAVSVALLLLVLIRQSDSERRLRHRFGKTFAPLFYSLLVGAFLLTGAILAALANFSLLTSVEYWYYLAITFGYCASGALVVVVVAPPSRLESSVQLRLTAGAASRVYWRILVNGVLLALLFLCAWAVYRKLALDAATLENMGSRPMPDSYAVIGGTRIC